VKPSGPQPTAADGSTEGQPPISTAPADVDQLVLEVVGEGGTHEEIRQRLLTSPEFTRHKSNSVVTARIYTGEGLQKLVSEGRLVEENGWYRPS
jgi:hypothetical protein